MTEPLFFAGDGSRAPSASPDADAPGDDLSALCGSEASKRSYKTHRKPQSDEPFVEKQRKCLMCGSSFRSAWSGERVCKRCKESAAWRSG